MKIAFVGGGVRIVGEYRWEGPGDVVEVEDQELVVKLLLQPGNSFMVARDEPLLTVPGIGPDMAGTLALEGVSSLAELAGLSRRRAGKLAKALRLDRDVVDGWMRQAQQIVLVEV